MGPSPPTAFAEVAVACAVCSRKSRQPQVPRFAAEGAPDLDLRPAGAARAAMPAWLQHCPGCGFTAPKLDRAPAAERAVVATAPYRSLRADDSLPELARRFLLRAMILEEAGDLHGAAEHTLHAAWVADDEDLAELAAAWRLDAVALFRSGPDLSEEQCVRLVDMLRRAGDMQGARAQAEALAEVHMADALEHVLAFEMRLLGQGDTAAHSIAAALPPPAHRPHAAQRGQARRAGPRPGLLARMLGWLTRRR